LSRIVLAACIALGACGDVLPSPVTKVTVAPTSANLIVGETVQLTGEARLSLDTVADRPLIWTSDNPAIATVSPTGLVTAIAPDATVTITATSEDISATAMIAVTGPPVSLALLGAPAYPMIVGATAKLDADLRDAANVRVLGRTVHWTSTDPSLVVIADNGDATATSLGGPVTLRVSYGDLSDEASTTTASGIVTGIADIYRFVQGCPDADPAFATIQADFELRENGVLLTPQLQCGPTYATTPLAQMSDELIAYQVLRIAYYMSKGTTGRLPWTQLALYDWMKGAIAGINFKTIPNQLYCCDVIDGKRYFSTSRLDDFNRDQKRDWPGLASSLDFFLHEVRHTDGPGHTTGCPAFPSPTGPAGCDATYDLTYLGSYGLQYWLNAGWAMSSLHIGIDCAPPDVQTRYFAALVTEANSFIDRFVTNAPPPVTAVTLFGGTCP